MKSINTMKMLKENRKEDIFKRKDNTSERKELEKIQKFVSDYVMPEILKLGLEDETEEYDFKIDILNYIRQFENINLSLNERELIFGKDYDYLGTATPSSKKRIARDFVEVMRRIKTYPEKINQYKEEYIIPILEKLVQENIITYDRNALDNKTKIPTKKIDKLVDKFLKDSLEMNITYALYKNILPSEYQELFGFIFNDNMEAKQNFANLLYNFINENINSIDFKKLDETNFGEYTGAKLKIVSEEDYFENHLQEEE